MGGGEEAVCSGEVGQKVSGGSAEVSEADEGEEDEAGAQYREEADGAHRHLQG